MTVKPPITKAQLTVWATVRDPHVIKTLHAITYNIVAVAGMNAYLLQPDPLAHVWGRPATYVWAGALTIGGLAAASACIAGVWWIEKIAITIICTGIALYGGLLLTLGLRAERLFIVQTMMMGVVLLQLIVRFIRIHHYTYEPGS